MINTLALLTILWLQPSAINDRVQFRDFRNTTGLNLIGQAAVVDKQIRLVPARRDSRGNVWVQKPFNVSGGFRASFAFRYTHQGGSTDGNGNHGNDGLRFFIQPIGNALQQNVDIPGKSLLIFFDGYKNYDKDDVSSSRVEVLVNGARLGQSDVEPMDVRYRDGKTVNVAVDYDGRQLCITMNDKPVVTYENVDLGAISPGYVGFHGMGGDAYADVDILNFRFGSTGERGSTKQH